MDSNGVEFGVGRTAGRRMSLVLVVRLAFRPSPLPVCFDDVGTGSKQEFAVCLPLVELVRERGVPIPLKTTVL